MNGLWLKGDLVYILHKFSYMINFIFFGLVLHAIVVGIWSNSQTHPPSKGFFKLKIK